MKKGCMKMMQFVPEGGLLETYDNRSYLKNLSGITEALHEGRILESTVSLCDSAHNMILDIGGIKGIIPREEGALGIKEGKVRDIAIISRVNRPVSFIVTALERDNDGSPVALLSRRLAQQRCMDNYVMKLIPGDIIPAKITHLEQFGAFADIGCGIASLLPIDSISVSRIDHPCRRFSVGDNIKAVVKSSDDGRICLSHKELLGTWQENADLFEPGQTVSGIVRSVEDYGAFIELTPNLAGLAEIKPRLKPGMPVSVYIKSIIPQRMKVKLIIIDMFDFDVTPKPPKYFYTKDKMLEFIYSPEECEKTIATSFTQ